jgi:uncharacterized protein YndB with AHSA1/START domain
MARNEMHVDAAPEDVFAVLADHRAYADWVVGSKEIRDADPDWPRVGSRFHHTVGFGPFEVRDHSRVVAAEPPHRFVMRVKARPLGTAKVELSMVPASGGTLIEMREEPWDVWSRLLHNPILDLALHTRNVESLRRLKRLAEGRRGGAPPVGGR